MHKLLAVLVLALTLIASVSAATSFDYQFQEIEVDGLEVVGAPIAIERGMTLPITVLLRGLNNKDGVRIQAEINGYEHGDIEDRTEIFKVTKDTVKKVDLSLNIPSDLEADKRYVLKITASDDRNEISQIIDLSIEKSRHKLEVLDVISPSEVQPGQHARFSVRVENMGDKDEEDIKVTVRIPDLGLSTRTYLDELVSRETSNDDDESSASADLVLRIPEGVQPGTYDVITEVEYNRGFDVTKQTTALVVGGQSQVPADQVMVNVDSNSKTVEQGMQTTYRLVVTNVKTTQSTYTVEVEGASAWATTSVEPMVLTLSAGQTAESVIKVNANQDASLGGHVFTAKVKANGQTVKEVTLNANVEEQENASWATTKTVLEVGFIVLLILLIILLIVVGVTKMTKKEKGQQGAGEETYY